MNKRDIRAQALAVSATLCDSGPKVTTPEALYNLMLPAFPELREQEHFVVMALDSSMRKIDCACLFSGSATKVLVDVATILRWALTRSRPAHFVVVAHNHPVGDPSPSKEDAQVTVSVVQACQAVGLELTDHIVIGGAEFSSMRRVGNAMAREGKSW